MNKVVRVLSDAVPEPEAGNFCNALRVGDRLFMSGMTASTPGGDAYAQSRACLEKIRALVEAAGGRMTDVVKITVFLTDIAHRTDFSRARSEFFPGRKPCSTLVAVSALAHPDLVVEVEATACIGAGE